MENIIINDIPIETLFKYAVKERKEALKELARLKEDYEYLKKENERLRKKIPAYKIDGSFVSQKNYETMANDKAIAMADCALYLSRLYQRDKEISMLKSKINELETELSKGKKTNGYGNIFFKKIFS